MRMFIKVVFSAEPRADLASADRVCNFAVSFFAVRYLTDAFNFDSNFRRCAARSLPLAVSVGNEAPGSSAKPHPTQYNRTQKTGTLENRTQPTTSPRQI